MDFLKNRLYTKSCTLRTSTMKSGTNTLPAGGITLLLGGSINCNLQEKMKKKYEEEKMSIFSLAIPCTSSLDLGVR